MTDVKREGRERPLPAVFLRLAALLFGFALLAAAPARSHEFSLESVMNAFVRVEAREAHIVVRVPLHLLKTVRLPATSAGIDLTQADPAIQTALTYLARDIVLSEEGHALSPVRSTGRLSLPSDRSFDTYEQAVAHVARPMDLSVAIFPDQGYFDAHLVYAIASPASTLMLRTTVAPELKDYVKLAVRYMRPGEEARAMVITSRSGAVFLNPPWYRAAVGFIALGIEHILSGADHLLFVLCLVIPLRSVKQVVGVVTVFTIAHSFTLAGAVFGLAPRGAWFPPFVEAAIAASIVYMALENIVGANLQRRWVITGLFGLVHGFGFSYGLQESLQFAGQHLWVSLFSFNLGIEIGQVAAVALMVPALALLRRRVAHARIVLIILSAIVAHTGWHWMLDRSEVLWKVEWPRMDWAAAVTLSRWAIGILIVMGLASLAVKRLGARRHAVAPDTSGDSQRGEAVTGLR